MYYPYAKLWGETEVVFSPIDNGKSDVLFEKPDEKFGFKTLRVCIPSYVVLESKGFSDEIRGLMLYTRANSGLILSLASQGGWGNANVF